MAICISRKAVLESVHSRSQSRHESETSGESDFRTGFKISDGGIASKTRISAVPTVALRLFTNKKIGAIDENRSEVITIRAPTKLKSRQNNQGQSLEDRKTLALIP